MGISRFWWAVLTIIFLGTIGIIAYKLGWWVSFVVWGVAFVSANIFAVIDHIRSGDKLFER